LDNFWNAFFGWLEKFQGLKVAALKKSTERKCREMGNGRRGEPVRDTAMQHAGGTENVKCRVRAVELPGLSPESVQVTLHAGDSGFAGISAVEARTTYPLAI
jgi:hypothetical protein